MKRSWLLKDDVFKRTIPDFPSSKHSGLVKSKLSEITEESSESIVKHKKGPSDICDIKALIATLRKSSEFVFYYLIWAVPKWSEFYTPYCLRYNIVNFTNIL